MAKDSQRGSGFKNLCYPCKRIYDRQIAVKHRDKINLRHRMMKHPTEKEKAEIDPLYLRKRKIRDALKYQIRTGKIKKPDFCNDCGKKNRIIFYGKKPVSELVADHYKGYAWENRFDVQWICRICDGIRRRKDK